MFCQLTLLVLLFSAIASSAQAQSDGPGQRYSIEWQNLPLADAVERIQGVAETPIFVDRRVDPNRRIRLAATNASVADILAHLASSARLGIARIEPLYYLGPSEMVDRLPALAAKRRRDVAALKPSLRKSLSQRRRAAWPKLTEPRGLVTRILAERGWKIAESERIPHDLWATGELPAMALSDQLTVLLAGFDLTFRVVPEQKTIEILPARWEAIEPRSRQRNPPPQVSPNPQATKQVFTLRVENQPVGRVLDQLAARLGWQLDVDEAAIGAANLSLNRLVSFEVENADADQLLEALLAPAGLKATRQGDRVRIAPK